MLLGRAIYPSRPTWTRPIDRMAKMDGKEPANKIRNGEKPELDEDEETMAKRTEILAGFIKEVAGRNVGTNASVSGIAHQPAHVAQNIKIHVTNENVMNKLENCEGATIHHSDGVTSNRQQASAVLDACIKESHQVLLQTETIEIELVGLKKPKHVRLPRIIAATKDEMLIRCKTDENYNPAKTAFQTLDWERNLVEYEDVVFQEGFILVGSGGSGKSTLLKVLMKDVVQKKFKKCERIRLVVYIQLKNVKGDKTGNIDEVLLVEAVNIVALDLEQRKTLLKWMKKNPGQILFIFDGYDQLMSGNVAKDEQIATDLYGRAAASQFLHGILSKCIFRGAMVVLSTREYSLQQMPFKTISDKILKLVGFSDENIEQVILDMSNENVLKKIKESDLVVFILCSSPLVMMFVVWSYSEEIDCRQPETKSGILMRVILNFVTSCRHSRGTTIINLLKLAKLALYGILNGKVVFSDEEIRRHNLLLDDLKDMIVGVPGKIRGIGNKERIMAGDFRRYFLHQSLQEIMAALDIILSHSDNFGEILSKLDAAYYEEIHALLIGLLLRGENEDMLAQLFEEIDDANIGRTAANQDPCSSTSTRNHPHSPCNAGKKTYLKMNESRSSQECEQLTESETLNRYVTMSNYAAKEEGQLSFNKGDHLIILCNREGKLYKARTTEHSDAKEGFIPSNYVRPATELELKFWFFAELSETDATEKLKSPLNKRGAFLIRPSSTGRGNYAISVLTDDALGQKTVTHQRITQHENGHFKCMELKFKSLTELVEHFSENRSGLPCKLGKPCPQKLKKISSFDAWQEDRESLKEKIALNVEQTWKGKNFMMCKLPQLRELALRYLQGRLDDGVIGDLRLMRLLYESGDASIIQHYVGEIILNVGNKFDAFCIGKILSQAKQLNLLQLNYATDELLGILVESGGKKIPKIDSLWVFHSTNVLGKNFSKLANKAMKIKLLQCKFTQEEFEVFVGQLDENKKFDEVRITQSHIEMEHLDALKRLIGHIKGRLELNCYTPNTIYINDDVLKHIPMQCKDCHVEYNNH